MISDDEVREIIPAYEKGVAELVEQRAAKLRAAQEGRTQARVVELTGVSREGLRRMTDPKAREAGRRASQATRAAARKAD